MSSRDLTDPSNFFFSPDAAASHNQHAASHLSHRRRSSISSTTAASDKPRRVLSPLGFGSLLLFVQTLLAMSLLTTSLRALLVTSTLFLGLFKAFEHREEHRQGKRRAARAARRRNARAALEARCKDVAVQVAELSASARAEASRLQDEAVREQVLSSVPQWDPAEVPNSVRDWSTQRVRFQGVHMDLLAFQDDEHTSEHDQQVVCRMEIDDSQAQGTAITLGLVPTMHHLLSLTEAAANMCSELDQLASDTESLL